ncbi:MAG: hypothetical protein II776_02355, partial [Clostridia bacterium]|nr:hypothetical protein [Clostridia bacterium]
ISSDIVGVLREKVEKNHDAVCLYMQGGAGNINPTSRITGEARFTGYRDIGNALFEHFEQGVNAGLTPVKIGPVHVAEETFDLEVNHDDDDKVSVAQGVKDILASNDRTGATTAARKAGFGGYFEATAIIRRSKMGATAPITVNAYSFGDIAIAAAPFEMFCQTEKKLREDSPFPFTFTCGYSNSSKGYMPAAECFGNRGYEVYQCNYVKGSAEVISEKQLRLLNDLYAAT